MKRELWRFSSREINNVLAVSGDEQSFSILLMMKIFEVNMRLLKSFPTDSEKQTLQETLLCTYLRGMTFSNVRRQTLTRSSGVSMRNLTLSSSIACRVSMDALPPRGLAIRSLLPCNRLLFCHVNRPSCAIFKVLFAL